MFTVRRTRVARMLTDFRLGARNLDPDEGPYKTVAGYIMERLGRIPAVGDSVDLGDYRLTVTAMDGLRMAAVEAQSLLDRSMTEETEQGVGH